MSHLQMLMAHFFYNLTSGLLPRLKLKDKNDQLSSP